MLNDRTHTKEDSVKITYLSGFSRQVFIAFFSLYWKNIVNHVAREILV